MARHSNDAHGVVFGRDKARTTHDARSPAGARVIREIVALMGRRAGSGCGERTGFFFTNNPQILFLLKS